MAFLAHGARCGMLDVFSESDPVVNFDGTPTINRPMTFQVNGEFYSFYFLVEKMPFYRIRIFAFRRRQNSTPNYILKTNRHSAALKLL